MEANLVKYLAIEIDQRMKLNRPMNDSPTNTFDGKLERFHCVRLEDVRGVETLSQVLTRIKRGLSSSKTDRLMESK